ncbi:hypothetical protein DICVIV_06249 [Dictyocaulus viviparus]|uniref:MARVEL domain-containing protein n=1 Tax=Dictyocaulus viviparus TaxID=29172 RepID=A0A0D8XV54_DICVI|nr:hypothetical protein DICVIV_06249 [Dictyocaulus viviparus]
MELLQKVKFIWGIFLSLSIVSTVLACALWDFQRQPLFWSILYMGGLILALILNSTIAFYLLIGASKQNSRMFYPYIVCSTIHSIISLSATVFFFGSSIYSLLEHKGPDDLLMLAIFAIFTVFWYWSREIVRQYRDHVRKLAGEHVKFDNDRDI